MGPDWDTHDCGDGAAGAEGGGETPGSDRIESRLAERGKAAGRLDAEGVHGSLIVDADFIPPANMQATR